MFRPEYGCSAAVLAVIAAVPLPFASLYSIFGSTEITRSEKMAIILFDTAKMALFVWGVIDTLSNGATNVGRIAIPYIACAVGALVPPVITTWNNPDYIK